MRTSRFFCSTISQNNLVVLSDNQFRHLTKVLRLKAGDAVELFDGKGTVANAVIEKIASKQAYLRIQNKQKFDTQNKQKIIIASSIAKGQRFEQIIARCCELGVDRISPIIFERTVKQSAGQTAISRYESIAIESAKQCGRVFLPVIDKPESFEQIARKLQQDYPDAKIIFGSLTDDSQPILNFSLDSKDVIAFIGPEGGFTDTEEDLLGKINAQPVRITNTVLRIETAAIAIAAILTAKRDLPR